MMKTLQFQVFGICEKILSPLSETEKRSLKEQRIDSLRSPNYLGESSNSLNLA